MPRLIIMRLFSLAPVLLGATVIVFALIRLAPGDPTQTLLGPNATEAAREALREDLGLNNPLYVQYCKWLWHAMRGDLGNSIEMQAPVLVIVMDRFANTLLLGLVSGFVGLFIGISVGILSAVLKNSLFDRAVLLVSMLGVSLPSYWLSVVLIYVFAVRLGWLPTGEMYGATGDRSVRDLLLHLVLPATAAVVIPAALIARFTRTLVLEFISQDFVTGLRAKGLPEWRVLHHVIRNAMPPIIGMSSIQIAYQILGQMLFIEVVFSWPGIGFQIFSAVASRDFPVIAGIVLLASLVFIFVNLMIEILTILLTPRSRFGEST
jgi:peptide/nickel transport system permease protein